MRLGLAARDLRVLALLAILGVMAAVLVMTSWPERRELSPEQGAESGAQLATSILAPTSLPAAGRRVATRWAESYFTSTRDDSATARRAGLEPYSSTELNAEMRIDSGALGLRSRNTKKRATSEAEVVALQEQDGTPGHALVAIVQRKTSEGPRKSTELVTVTLALVQHEGTWVVDEVLVP